MQNVAAGDLYIRVHTLNTDKSTDRLFGLVLEDRTGTASDPWFQLLKNAGYTSLNDLGVDNPYDTAKQQGELWQLTDNSSGFATGTYEGYAGKFDNHLPLMSDARLLPGLIDHDPNILIGGTEVDDMLNAYPTLLLNGIGDSAVTTANSSAAWVANPTGYLDPDGVPYATSYGYDGGVWTGEFTLPSSALITGDEVSIWWSMACGNDGSAITGVTGVEVPLPSSLVLCCFGLGFMAVRRLKIRK